MHRTTVEPYASGQFFARCRCGWVSNLQQTAQTAAQEAAEHTRRLGPDGMWDPARDFTRRVAASQAVADSIVGAPKADALAVLGEASLRVRVLDLDEEGPGGSLLTDDLCSDRVTVVVRVGVVVSAKAEYRPRRKRPQAVRHLSVQHPTRWYHVAVEDADLVAVAGVNQGLRLGDRRAHADLKHPGVRVHAPARDVHAVLEPLGVVLPDTSGAFLCGRLVIGHGPENNG